MTRICPSASCGCFDPDPPTIEDLARVRRRGLFTVEAKTRTVYTSNIRGLETKRNARKTRMTASRAYLDAAWALWCEGHPCTCGIRNDGKIDRTCPEHVFDREPVHRSGWDPDEHGYDRSVRGTYRQKAITRLARWLRWRDGRLREVATWLGALGLVLALRPAPRGLAAMPMPERMLATKATLRHLSALWQIGEARKRRGK